MVAASPVLTTNALARMLEERPDPSAFQPVLQIAGIVLFTFLIIKRCCSFFLFFFFERINSLCAREIEFLNKKESCEIQFLMFLRSSFPFTHDTSNPFSHAQTSGRLRTRPANRNRRRTRDTGSWSGMFFVWKSSHLKSGHFLNFFSFTPSLRSSRAAWETILLRLLLLL